MRPKSMSHNLIKTDERQSLDGKRQFETMPAVGEEIELAAKTAEEVVAALADESGALAVPKEYATFIAARIHLRHRQALVVRAMAVVEKIRKLGLPRRAFAELDEPLLTAILEGMAEETDPDLQEVWENLLTAVLTEHSAQVHRAFPRIVRELAPADAQRLDKWAESYPDSEVIEPFDDQMVFDNLVRLGLLESERRFKLDGTGYVYEGRAEIGRYKFTELGWAFACACHPYQFPGYRPSHFAR
jgi:hypothetical protein